MPDATLPQVLSQGRRKWSAQAARKIISRAYLFSFPLSSSLKQKAGDTSGSRIVYNGLVMHPPARGSDDMGYGGRVSVLRRSYASQGGDKGLRQASASRKQGFTHSALHTPPQLCRFECRPRCLFTFFSLGGAGDYAETFPNRSMWSPRCSPIFCIRHGTTYKGIPTMQPCSSLSWIHTATNSRCICLIMGKIL